MSGEPFEFEVRARRFDGVYRWFQSRGLPLRDSSGHIVRWYVLLIDIDDRKRAEEALRRASARQLILDSALDCIVTIDHEGWIIEFNPDCGAHVRLPARREFLGQQLADVIIPTALRESAPAGVRPLPGRRARPGCSGSASK